MSQLTRRSFIATAAGGVSALAAACTDATTPDLREPDARLLVRWRPPYAKPVLGLNNLGLRDQFTGRDGLLYVPPSYNVRFASPLLVCLHGANGSGTAWTSEPWLALMDEFNAVMIAPDSRAFNTWDLLDVGAYGADVGFMDEALATVFRSYNIDRTRIAISGFSDGASEALGLGLLNGDLFTGVIGFSPGFLYAPFARGRPRTIISHGDADTVLSYANSKDSLVPAIAALGVPIRFESFSGGHQLTLAVARTALHYALLK